jgi:PAS domain S-box-containing protein
MRKSHSDPDMTQARPPRCRAGRYSLRVRLSVAFMAAALVPLGLLCYLSQRNMEQTLTHNANEALLTAASHTALSLDSFVNNNLKAIGAEAQLPALIKFLNLPFDRREGGAEEIEATSVLQALSRKDEVNISSYALLDYRGRILIDTRASDLAENEFDRSSFLQAIKTGTPCALPVEFSGAGRAYIHFSAPVRDPAGGEIIGVLSVRFDAAALETIIARNSGLAGKQSYAVLLDENHFRLAHGTRPDLIFRSVTPVGPDLAKRLQTAHRLPGRPLKELSTHLPDFERALLNAEKQPFFSANIDGEGNQVSSAAVARTSTQPWFVVFAQAQSVLLAPVQAQSGTALALGLTIAVLAILAAVGAAGRFAAPIIHLTGVARQVAQGSLSARAGVGSRDEFGMLADTFDSMIAKLQQTIDSFRKSEERYRKIYENALEGIFQTSFEGRELSTNPAMARILGYDSSDELAASGDDVWQQIYVHPEEREALHSLLLEQGTVLGHELQFYRKDKQIVWVSINVRVVRDDAGEPLLLEGFLTDITERKRAEAALKEQSDFLQTLIDTLPNPVFYKDREGRYTGCNKSFEDFTGRSRQELMGKTVYDLGPADVARTYEEKDNELFANPGKQVYEWLLKSRNGELRNVIFNKATIMGAANRVTGLVGIIADITERKQAEEKLEKHRKHLEELVAELAVAKERAEAASQAKSAFLANMSHELRTPMTAILGYTQLLLRTPSLPREVEKHLETINTSSEQLLALINDVLEISRIETKQVSLNVDFFDLHALIADLEGMFHGRIKAKGLQFEIIGTDEVSRYVATDENKLRQVLINLLGNAVKFTEQGGIFMRIDCQSPTANGQRVLRFEVEDTGVGIARDELDKVFRYFEQTESGRKSQRGTGLGMAISRDYARMMGGDVTVESTVGKGSTFRLEIRVREGSEADITQRARERRVIGLAPGQTVPRILVAEDLEQSRTLLVRILDAVGFEVREAVNGKRAVEIFHHWKPHLIWMDIRMPIMDGLEATRLIKGTEAGKSTVIAALTAHALEEEREEILAAGCNDFVRKPYREQEIFEVMARHLGVNYLYEGEEEQTAPIVQGAIWRPERFAALPEDLRVPLRQAVIELDTDRILALIEQISELDASIGSMLHGLAVKLDYERLLSLLEDDEAAAGDNS